MIPGKKHYVQYLILMLPPRSKSGKEIKIKFITQVKSEPPVFAFFANEPKLIEDSYVRFLESDEEVTDGTIAIATLNSQGGAHVPAITRPGKLLEQGIQCGTLIVWILKRYQIQSRFDLLDPRVLLEDLDPLFEFADVKWRGGASPDAVAQVSRAELSVSRDPDLGQ